MIKALDMVREADVIVEFDAETDEDLDTSFEADDIPEGCSTVFSPCERDCPGAEFCDDCLLPMREWYNQQ